MGRNCVISTRARMGWTACGWTTPPSCPRSGVSQVKHCFRSAAEPLGAMRSACIMSFILKSRAVIARLQSWAVNCWLWVHHACFLFKVFGLKGAALHLSCLRSGKALLVPWGEHASCLQWKPRLYGSSWRLGWSVPCCLRRSARTQMRH